ncbi:hypothetical protein SAMN04489809_3488 [Microbacterium paraoxydans]|uniref:Uncharacterized protein n=1 Tax=Microbacterium paraoxydans TaxID=199592 RepID=A0A1H1XIS2_9MICO|nr:hypothetical protein SAMN04489809_0053 [Microbacterium paraoxydans]SDT09043.1 hypothetical protein SAMN04489809_3488 [Microbacterium paraoxydans]
MTVNAIKDAARTVYEWDLRLGFNPSRFESEPTEIAKLRETVRATRASCNHDWKNRVGTYGATGLGAECTKCGQHLEHDFDPYSDRGHPVGKTCTRCGATEWMYVDGLLCLIPEQTPLYQRGLARQERD